MIFDSQYQQQRLKKADEMREAGKNPYANITQRDSSNEAFKIKFAYVAEIDAEEKKDENQSACIAGRLKFLRLMGKAAFAKIEDESGILQIYFSKNELGEEFDVLKKNLDIGDILEAKGFPFVTKTGELSLHVTGMQILTKSLNPLPEKFHGLTDIEARYRQRYLDLIMNPDVKNTFKLRSKVVSLIRRFFEEKGFLEVETPMMHPIPGGANARPFITHHNALGIDRFLRIAPELYLKRLIVGGFEAVFEINRNFRNEGMDHSHNPEFTMIEFYWAYKRYNDLIDITIEMFNYLFDSLGLAKQLPYGEATIDFSEFKRIAYLDAIEQIGGIDRSVITDKESLKALLQKEGVRFERELKLGELQAEAFDCFVEHKLINPTFITDFPIEISPLARRSDANPDIAERFELFIAGKEIANGFSELNDPVDQYNRFKGQVEAKDAGDLEAQHMDEDYVDALGYGMAPTAGEGIGIDRLVMLLTNSHTIKDVILFPAMKPTKHDTQKDNE